MKKDTEKIVFPVTSTTSSADEREIIRIFLERYHDIDFMRVKTKICKSIEKTSSLTGRSILVISDILVRYGLRATKQCFPIEFQHNVIRQYERFNLERAIFPIWYHELTEFWQKDDPLSAFYIQKNSSDGFAKIE